MTECVGVASFVALCELLQKTCSAQVLFEQRQRKCKQHPAQFRVPGAGDARSKKYERMSPCDCE